MSRTCNGRIRGRALGLSTTLLSAAGLIWVGASGSALAQQAYNGGPNQVIVNMDVLNGLPGGYGAGYGAPAQSYGQAPKSQFLPGAAPQGYAAAPSGPVGVPRYLPPYTPYGVAGAGAQPLPLAPGLAGLATPPSSTPSSVLTTLGPDGRPLQPIKLKQPGTGTKQASKPKKKEYAAPAQPAPTETASASEAASEPVAAPEPEPTEEQVATIEPPTPPAEPEAVPDAVPMPEPTPAPDATGAIVETAPAVAAPEPPAEEPTQQAAVAPEAPAPEAPAVEAPE
ncbi:MAG TPA: hypothetical protein VG742_02415, partial [Dongiaceae bacterium]|nr:hypothetical protein [Dongiaceae bacterium]